MEQILINLRARRQARFEEAANLAATGDTKYAERLFILLSDARTIHQIINDLENPTSTLFAGLY